LDVTIVVPIGKIEPDAGVETIDAGGEQVSDAVGVKATVALQVPGAAGTVIGAGQTIDGGVLSTTVTLPVAWLVAPRGSTTVSSTGVVPSAYGPAGDCVIVNGSPSGSDDPSSIDADAMHVSALAKTVTFFAFAIGTWFGAEQLPKQAPETESE
jgi:hypothetical protein